jgi:ribokinase
MSMQAKPKPVPDVIVCGSLHLDIVVKAPALPKLDETAVGNSWQRVCGGKGGNQAVQAARAGAKTAMIGRVGDDDFGRILMENLDACGVDSSEVTIDPARGSGMSVAILQDDGEYGAVIVSGANLEIDALSLGKIFTRLGGTKILILQNEIPHGVNVAAAGAARNAGATVVLNAAPARALGSDLLDNIDVLIVNRVEAEEMSGKPVFDQQSAEAALVNLAGKIPAVIITLGGGGLVVGAAGKAPVFISAIPVQVISAHGAGDCFVGVIAAQLAKGKSIVEASHAANRAAAAHVSHTS